MLSCAIAHHYGHPVPKYTNNNDSNDFIGHPKHKPMYEDTPRIASAHHIPHRLYDSRIFRAIAAPAPTAFLVRDIRHAVVSYYEKWQTKLDMPFSEFLQGDKTGNSHWADIWWHIRFYNRWGRVMSRFPRDTCLLRYEDVQKNSKQELSRIFDHFNVEIEEKDLDFAIGEGSKENMAAKSGVDVKEGAGQYVRLDKRDPLDWFSEDDMKFFKSVIDENLKYRFGYNY
jgi:hypothetical protein